MSDSDDETQANRGSPPFGVNYEMNDKEEEDPGSDEEMMDTDFNPINTAQNELDDVDVSRSARNRVKLYVLCEQRTWDDRGTGHVACVQVPGQNVHVIIVRLEAAEKNVLESKILLDTVYQKQQETLIVWSESESCDLALSFQEKTGCEEIWGKICEVQGKDPAEADSSYDEPGDDEESILDRRIRIPPIIKDKLQDLDRAITYHLQNNERREKMSNAIEKEEMIPKLIEIFEQAESEGDLPALHFLYNITKNCILMNRNNIHDVSLFQILFEDQYLKDVVGMLEYDPAHEPRKHREFLYEKAQFKEVLPINDTELTEKIHKVYRVQYIQDICLPAPSLFEENLMGALNSYLFFLRVDICTGLQNNDTFMKDLIGQLKSTTITLSRRRDLVQFLKEFINLSHSFPQSGTPQKESILKGLFNCDILGVVDPCLQSSDPVVRSTIIEVLLYLTKPEGEILQLLSKLVENNPQLVREYFIKQARGKTEVKKSNTLQNDILLNQLMEAMHSDNDVELSSANQVSNILRALLDMDSIVSSMQKIDRSEFLNLFYQTSFKTLVRPFVENVASGNLKRDDFHFANASAMVIRMLCFCIETHSFNMRSQVVNNDLLNKVLIALKSRHHFLVLTALKMLRSVIGQKDDYYNRYIVREKVLDKVVSCFERNGHRYNLLNSAILELFEYIRTEDLRILIKYVIESHSEVLMQIDYVNIFNQMKTRYDVMMDKDNKLPDRGSRSSTASENLAQHFEDQWLEAEDDELENACEEDDDDLMKRGDLVLPLKRKNAFDEDDTAIFSGHLMTPVERKIVIKVGTEDRSRTPSPSLRDDEVSSSQNGKSTAGTSNGQSSSVLKRLVDYDGSSSDDEEEAASSADSVPSSSTGSPDSGKRDSSVPQSRSPNGEDSVSSTSGDEEQARGLKRQMPKDFSDVQNATLDLSSKRPKVNGPKTNGHSSHQPENNPEDPLGTELFDLTSYDPAEARETMRKAALKQADPIYCRVEDYGLLNNVDPERQEPVELSNGDECPRS